MYPPYPIVTDPLTQEREAYGQLRPFQPRFQPMRQGYTGGYPWGNRAAILFDGYPNRTWSFLPTDALKRTTTRGALRGIAANLPAARMAWPASNGQAGAAPATGIYTGVDDENC